MMNKSIIKINTLQLSILKEIVILSMLATANKISVEEKWWGKRGVTLHA